MSDARRVVTVADFPDGLRCYDCSALLEADMAYSERLEDVFGDTFLVVLTCVPCALKGAVKGP